MKKGLKRASCLRSRLRLLRPEEVRAKRPSAEQLSAAKEKLQDFTPPSNIDEEMPGGLNHCAGDLTFPNVTLVDEFFSSFLKDGRGGVSLADDGKSVLGLRKQSAARNELHTRLVVALPRCLDTRLAFQGCEIVNRAG